MVCINEWIITNLTVMHKVILLFTNFQKKCNENIEQ